MSLLDTSPGRFIVVANAVLYAVVLAETWMLTTSSIVAMAGVMVLIVAVAGGLVRWMGRLLGPEDYALGEAPKPAVAPEPTVAAPRPVPVSTGRAAHA